MKLSLDKNWYKIRIAHEGDLDVTAGVPLEEHDNTQAGTEQPAQPTEDLPDQRDLDRQRVGGAGQDDVLPRREFPPLHRA